MEASKPIIYSGPGFSPKGEKGRFVLPAQFRHVVKQSSDGESRMFLGKHEQWNCLIGYGQSRQLELSDDLEAQRLHARDRDIQFDYDTRSTQLFTYIQVNFDDSGRFSVPPGLIKSGHVGETMFFLGGGKFFSLWNPVELKKMGPAWDAMKEMCEAEEEAFRNKGRKS